MGVVIMRKTIKVGLVLLVLGLIMVMFGVANNGIQAVYWDSGFHIAKRQTKTYQLKQVKQITLATANNVTIRQGNTTSIKITANRTLPTVTTKDGHVTIKSATHNSETIGFMFNNTGSFADTTVITVPKGTTIDRIDDRSQQSGNVSLQNVTANHVQLLADDNNVSLSNVEIQQSASFTADSLHLTQVTAPSLQVTSDNLSITNSQFTEGASKITLDDDSAQLTNSKFKALQLHMTDGNLTLTNNQITDSLTASTVDGNIHVTAPKSIGVTAVTNDGNLNVFGNTNQSRYQYNQQATPQYHLTTDDGNITVTAS